MFKTLVLMFIVPAGSDPLAQQVLRRDGAALAAQALRNVQSAADAGAFTQDVDVGWVHLHTLMAVVDVMLTLYPSVLVARVLAFHGDSIGDIDIVSAMADYKVHFYSGGAADLRTILDDLDHGIQLIVAVRESLRQIDPSRN